MAAKAQEHPAERGGTKGRNPSSGTAEAWVVARRLLPAGEVVGVVVAAPLLLFPNPFTLVALVLLPVLWLARLLLLGSGLRRNAADWPLLGLLLMTCVSLYPSIDLGRSLPRLYGLLLGFYLFAGVVQYAANPETRRAVALGLLLAGIEMAIVGVVGTEWKESAGKLPVFQPIYDSFPRVMEAIAGSSRRVPPGLNPNEVGAMVALLFPFAFAIAVFRRSKVLSAVGWLSVLFTGPVLVLTASRSAWFGGVMGLFSIFWFRWPRLSWMVGIVLVVTLATAAWIGPKNLLMWVAAVETGASTEARIDLWDRAWKMVNDFPLTGVGLNTFQLVLDYSYPLPDPNPRAIHAHNIFLQTAVDFGLVGLAALMGMLVAAGLGLIRGRRTELALSAGLAGGLVAYFFYGLPDAAPLGARHGILIWPMLGIAVALGVGNYSGEDRTSVWGMLLPWLHWMLFTLACGLGMYIGLSGLPKFV